MCFIMLILGRGDKVSIVKSTFENEMETNKDGYALVSSAGDYIRTTDKQEFKKWIAEKRTRLNRTEAILLHYRLGTNGELGIRNVHLWKFGNWYVCHNGAFFRWNNKSGECDSYRFYDNYKQYLQDEQWTKLKEAFEEETNWGVIAGLNPVEGKYFWMASPHKTFVAIKNRILIVTSTEWKMKRTYNLLGWKVERIDNRLVYGEYNEWMGKVGAVNGTVLWERWRRDKPEKWVYNSSYGYGWKNWKGRWEYE